MKVTERLRPNKSESLNSLRVPLHYSKVLTTVKPSISGHPWDQKKWPLKRGVRSWEVSVCM